MKSEWIETKVMVDEDQMIRLQRIMELHGYESISKAIENVLLIGFRHTLNDHLATWEYYIDRR